MRLLAIGDIHGCLTALDTLLQIVKLQPTDQLVTLGDYVDRGPESAGVIDRILELHQRFRVVSLRGNHEVMMLEARDSSAEAKFWAGCHGYETLQSYPQPSLDAVPDEHWHFLDETCRPWFETERHIFVHANLDPELALDDQPPEQIYWEKFSADWAIPHVSGKIMVCGHTEQRNGEPLSIDFAHCIDTWAFAGQWLTCLNVIDGRYWQANNRGKTRTGWLK